jgi:hypothetical protein
MSLSLTLLCFIFTIVLKQTSKQTNNKTPTNLWPSPRPTDLQHVSYKIPKWNYNIVFSLFSFSTIILILIHVWLVSIVHFFIAVILHCMYYVQHIYALFK